MSRLDGTGPKGVDQPDAIKESLDPAEAKTRGEFRERLCGREEQVIDAVRSDEGCNKTASKLAEASSPKELKQVVKTFDDTKELAQKYEDAVFGNYANDAEKQEAVSTAADEWTSRIKDRETVKMALEKFEPSGNWDKVKAAIAMPIIAFGVGHDMGTLPVEAVTGETRYAEIMQLPPDPLDPVPSDSRPVDLLKHRPLIQLLDGYFKDVEKAAENKEPDMSLESIKGDGEFLETWFTDMNSVTEENETKEA